VSGAAHQRIEISFASPLRIVHADEPPPILAVLTITYEQFTITVKGDVMYTLPVDKMVKMQVSYVDRVHQRLATMVRGSVQFRRLDPRSFKRAKLGGLGLVVFQDGRGELRASWDEREIGSIGGVGFLRSHWVMFLFQKTPRDCEAF
jgi:hypothetical protein